MRTVPRSTFTIITTVGAILPADLLQRVVEGRDLDGLRPVTQELSEMQDSLIEMVEERVQDFLEAHHRVRVAGWIKGISHRLQAQLSVEVLGVYVLLPA